MERTQQTPGLDLPPFANDSAAPQSEIVVPEFLRLTWAEAISIGRQMLFDHTCLCPRDHIAMSIEALPASGRVRAACPHCGAYVVAARLSRDAR